MFQVRIFDAAGNIVEPIITELANLDFNPRWSDAWETGFSIKPNEPILSVLDIGKEFVLYQDDTPLCRCLFSERDYSSRPWTFRGESTAIYLKQGNMRTPGDWTYLQWKPEDAIRDLLQGFVWVNQAKEAWDNAYYLSNLAQVVVGEEDLLVLGKDAEGRYCLEGTIQYPPVDMGAACTGIKRVRWSQSIGEGQNIFMHYRLGNTAEPDGTWTAWSVAMETPDSERGLDIPGTGYRYCQLQFDFKSDDNLSPGLDGTPIGHSPILYAAEVIGRTAGRITAGTIATSSTQLGEEIKFDYTDHLAAISTICQSQKWVWYVDPDNVLHCGPESTMGTNLSETVVFIEGQNCQVKSYREDRSNIENVIVGLGSGQGTSRIKVLYRNQASIDKYGEYLGKYENAAATSKAVLLTEVQNYAAGHADPIVEVSLATGRQVNVSLGDTIAFGSPSRNVFTGLQVREISQTLQGYTFGLNTSLRPLRDVLVGIRRSILVPAGAVQPSPPVDVRSKGENNEVRLSWSGRADTWEVQHTADTDSNEPVNWRPLTAGIDTRYVHRDLTLGSDHYYRIRAITGKQSSEWVQIAGRAINPNAPAAPGSLDVAAIMEKAVQLTWDPVTDAAEYNVYRKAGNSTGDPAGAVIVANEVNTNHVDIVDTAGEYTWFVSAVSEGEIEGTLSVGMAATVVEETVGPDTTAPGSLAGCGITVDSDTVYQDAQGNNFVKVKVSLTGIPADEVRNFIQIMHRKNGSTEYQVRDAQLRVTSGNASAWVDDLLVGTTYDFAAVPYSYYGVSGTGKEKTAYKVGQDSTAPAIPTLDSNVVQVVGGIKVSGSQNTEPDFYRYEVHISTTADFIPTGWNGSAWGAINQVKDWNGTTNTLAAIIGALPFNLTGLVPGTVYYVKATALDRTMNRSNPSTAVSGTAGKLAGKVSLSDDIVGQLTGDYLADKAIDLKHWTAGMQTSAGSWDQAATDADTLIGWKSEFTKTAAEINATVTEVFPSGDTSQESYIDQQAGRITAAVARLDYVSKITGTIDAVGTATLTDNDGNFTLKGVELKGMVVRVLVTGPDTKTYGVLRTITSYTSNVLTLDSAWNADYKPAVGATYTIGLLAIVQGTQIDQTNEAIRLVAVDAKTGSDFAGQFAALALTPSEISTAVTEVFPDGTAESSKFTQLSTSIEAKVSKDGIITALNLSTEEAKITGKKIVLDGDTEVTGTFTCDKLSAGTLDVQRLNLAQWIGREDIPSTLAGNKVSITFPPDSWANAWTEMWDKTYTTSEYQNKMRLRFNLGGIQESTEASQTGCRLEF
jgi:fibronectin type 3 domain-containing protein